jgi:hypothetical protein
LGAEKGFFTFDPATEQHTADRAEAANPLFNNPIAKGFELPDLAHV